MRITAIVAASLMFLYLLIILISLPFQAKIIQNMQIINSELYYNNLPMFPTVIFVFSCLTLACIVGLVFVCYGKSNSIASEILILICLFAVLPAISNFVSQIRVHSGLYIHNIDFIYNRCSFIVTWAKSIAYLVCGMSIAHKRMSKKPRNLWNDSHEFSKSL